MANLVAFDEIPISGQQMAIGMLSAATSQEECANDEQIVELIVNNFRKKREGLFVGANWF